jgi:aspartyl-tRNA(Asn)/glutamyl-tRNA(Gln) amidotransferase subunit C
MTKVSREEVLKVARMSSIALREEEIEPLTKRMQEILSYAQRVAQVATAVEGPSTKNVNALRNDVAVRQDPEKILAQMPERAGDYCVVPMILDPSWVSLHQQED